MDYQEFIDRVRERGLISDFDQAARAATATVQTLSERLQGGESGELLAKLPKALQRTVRPHESSMPYGEPDFVKKVSERENVSIDDARRHVRAVFKTLEEAAAPGQIDELRGQLPKEFDSLLPRRDEPSS